jgi:hypothetical protein
LLELDVVPDEPDFGLEYVSGEVSGPLRLPPLVTLLVVLDGLPEPSLLVELDEELPEGCEPPVEDVSVLLGVPVPLESVGDPAPELLALRSVPPLSVVPRDVPALGYELVPSVELVVVSAVVAGIVEEDDAGAVRCGLCMILARVACAATAAFD